MAEEIEFRYTKLTLVGVEDHSMGAKVFKDGSHIHEVLLWSRTSNKNVVNIGICRSDSMEYLEMLEHL